MRLWIVVTLIAVNCALAAGAAGAATDQERCVTERAKAKRKYDRCVGDWLANLYRGVWLDYPSALRKLATCRVKYDSAWTRLQSRGSGTTCNQPRFVDNGNGTITDNLAGLVWEKKSDDGGIHDRDAAANWTAGPPYTYNGDGTAFATFLTAGLNASGFAGAHDWRLPTFAELQTIVSPEGYPCATAPCVPPAFNTACTPGCTVTTCSCTQSASLSGSYWTATTFATDSTFGWQTQFVDGSVDRHLKANVLFVRAVRGGL